MIRFLRIVLKSLSTKNGIFYPALNTFCACQLWLCNEGPWLSYLWCSRCELAIFILMVLKHYNLNALLSPVAGYQLGPASIKEHLF